MTRAPSGHICIARDFSETPGGRYRTDGLDSGEAFRDDVLDPALEKFETVHVHLDDPVGLPASFLEEAFGGIVRKHGFAIAHRIKFVSERRKTEAEQIFRFMFDAQKRDGWL